MWNMWKGIHSSFKPEQAHRHHRGEKPLIGPNLCQLWPYLIFVTGTMGGARGENLVMWRNLSTWQMVRWSNSPHDRLSCGKNSPHGKREENMWKMWRNNVVFCRILCYFVAESFYCDLRCFIAKYVSSRFTRFCVEKFFLKKLPVEKKWQIWGMISCRDEAMSSKTRVA